MDNQINRKFIPRDRSKNNQNDPYGNPVTYQDFLESSNESAYDYVEDRRDNGPRKRGRPPK